MTIEEEIVVRTSGMLETIRKLEKERNYLEARITDTVKVLNRVAEERDEWRTVADLLAADADEAAIGIGDSDALTKFKELEKKYPL